MQTTPQDDLLIAVALSTFSYEFEGVDDYLADRAWDLAVAHAEQHGIPPNEIVNQIDWST